MVSNTLQSPDPSIAPVTEGGAMSRADYESHVRMYNRVLGMAKWFITHLAIILVALYFFVIAENAAMGTALVIFSIVIMLYGFLRRRPIREDVEHAVRGDEDLS